MRSWLVWINGVVDQLHYCAVLSLYCTTLWNVDWVQLRIASYFCLKPQQPFWQPAPPLCSQPHAHCSTASLHQPHSTDQQHEEYAPVLMEGDTLPSPSRYTSLDHLWYSVGTACIWSDPLSEWWVNSAYLNRGIKKLKIKWHTLLYQVAQNAIIQARFSTGIHVPKTSNSREECFLYWLQCFIPWAVAVSILREGFTRFEFKDWRAELVLLCWATCNIITMSIIMVISIFSYM